MTRKVLPLLVLLTITACRQPAEPDLGGMPLQSIELIGALRLSSVATVENDSVIVRLLLRNDGLSPSTMEFGLCSFAVRGVGASYTWDNRLPVDAGCPDLGISLVVPAGASREHLAFARPVQLLQRSSTPEQFSVTVYYRFRQSSTLHASRAGAVSF